MVTLGWKTHRHERLTCASSIFKHTDTYSKICEGSYSPRQSHPVTLGEDSGGAADSGALCLQPSGEWGQAGADMWLCGAP